MAIHPWKRRSDHWESLRGWGVFADPGKRIPETASFYNGRVRARGRCRSQKNAGAENDDLVTQPGLGCNVYSIRNSGFAVLADECANMPQVGHSGGLRIDAAEFSPTLFSQHR
jgi:hypothetical protein